MPVPLTLYLSLNLVIWNPSNSICLRNSLSVTRQFKINASFDVDSRAKRYLSSRVLYTSKGISSFKFQRKLTICGDVAENAGPRRRSCLRGLLALNARRMSATTKTPSCVLRVTLGLILNALVCPRLSSINI